MKKNSIYFLSVSILLLIGLAAYYHEDFGFLSQEKNLNKNEEDRQPIQSNHPKLDKDEAIVQLNEEQIKKNGLMIQTAAAGRLKVNLSTRGKVILDPDKVAHVFPKIAGIAKDPKKSIGHTVEEGEIIAVIESQEMADLKASYLAAESKEKLAASLLQREESLHQKKISSAQDYLNALQMHEESKINLMLALQKLQAYGLDKEAIQKLTDESKPDLNLYTIPAPITGTIIKRHLTKGEYVDDETLIYEIADLSSVLIEMAIYPKDLHRIQKGMKVNVVNLEDGSKDEAVLIYISPLITDEALSAKAIAQLYNPHGKWRPGSIVAVDVAIDQIDAPVMICKKGIQKMEGSDCTFVQTEKGFEKRELTLGRSDSENVEVLAGIAPGDRYAAGNSFLLKADLNKDSAKDED